MNFADAEGDVNLLRTKSLATGQLEDKPVGTLLTSGVLSATVMIDTSMVRFFQFTPQVFDAKDNPSNVMTGTLTVSP